MIKTKVAQVEWIDHLLNVACGMAGINKRKFECDVCDQEKL